MKDIVANRRRISWRNKARLAMRVLRDNGPIWCAMFGLYYVSSAIADKASGSMTRLRIQKGVPGLNSVAMNREIWNSWDWSAAGKEWTVSDAWYESLIRNVLRRWIPSGSSVLEIGPGAGRWSEPLIDLAGRYVGVDVSTGAIEFCRKRFRDARDAEFMVGSGTDLSGVADQSIDRIWSFDVFVHINAADIAKYLDEFNRVLKPGGLAIIHHGTVAGQLGGWRSDLMGSAMNTLLAERGFVLQASVDRWDDCGSSTALSGYGDLISIFARGTSDTCSSESVPAA